jgi:outer membrane protein assembly factor BamA
MNAVRLALWSAVFSVPVAGSEEPPVIGRIEIVVDDVFEDEGSTPEAWPYQFANQVHIETKEAVIRRELLFREGDTVDPEALAQTERNLRLLPFLRKAHIETIPAEGDGTTDVTVRVLVGDSWSTEPQARLSKVGNEWVWALGGSEKNLFGRGMELEAVHRSDFDRDQTYGLFRDPRLFGSRFALSTYYADASDGHHAAVVTNRPFFSLDSRWSFRVGYEDFDRLDPLYLDGERIEDLRHKSRHGELAAARAVRRTARSALRLHLGYQYSDDQVETDERRFGTLQFGLSSVVHSFRQLTHVNRFERTEDVNLGNEAAAFVGLSTPSLGGEPGNSYFFFLAERRGFELGPDGFLLGRASWEARHRHEGMENSIARFYLNFVQKLPARQLVLAKAEYQHGTNLDPEVQIRLGAESGLRGYPVRQFNGTRSLLLSVEGRWFLADDVLKLFSIGVAGFADSGYAWPEGTAVALHDLRSDVGLSLLLGSNRVSASRPGVRFDLAYALQPVEGRGRWLFSAGSQLGF